jgi:hypothetical protein
VLRWGQAYETEVDAGCPQLQDFEIVRCSGHQHIGARCITMYNAETDERICQSCPVIGTEEGAHSSSRDVCNPRPLATCGLLTVAWI